MMTDRHAGYVIVLSEDLREDDAQAMIDAFKLFRSVLTVEPIKGNPEIQMATHRARAEIEKKLWTAIQEEVPDG